MPKFWIYRDVPVPFVEAAILAIPKEKLTGVISTPELKGPAI